MKKQIALLLAFVMVACLFAGCAPSGGNNDKTDPDDIADEMTS